MTALKNENSNPKKANEATKKQATKNKIATSLLGTSRMTINP
ncbi:MAG: hypothetical protein P8M71_00655 [Pseudomonadales bacterium]|nr:hypothetical protein [Pseudomonadales bacterium]